VSAPLIAFLVLSHTAAFGWGWIWSEMRAEDRTNRRWVHWAHARHKLSKIITGAD